jgi:hypothetical protein
MLSSTPVAAITTSIIEAKPPSPRQHEKTPTIYIVGVFLCALSGSC